MTNRESCNGFYSKCSNCEQLQKENATLARLLAEQKATCDEVRNRNTYLLCLGDFMTLWKILIVTLWHFHFPLRWLTSTQPQLPVWLSGGFLPSPSLSASSFLALSSLTSCTRSSRSTPWSSASCPPSQPSLVTSGYRPAPTLSEDWEQVWRQTVDLPLSRHCLCITSFRSYRLFSVFCQHDEGDKVRASHSNDCRLNPFSHQWSLGLLWHRQ